MIYRELYMNRILPFIDKPFIKILTGIRRSGKSTILKMIQAKLLESGVKPEQILFYRFDSIELEFIHTSADMFNEIKKNLYPDGKTYLLLDEVQEIENWEKVVNSLMTDFDVDIFVTGSNSRMMSSEISTYLTGRYIAFKIFPLTFAEYLNFRREYTTVADTRAELARFIQFGGFPALHLYNFNLDEVYTIVRDISRTLLNAIRFAKLTNSNALLNMFSITLGKLFLLLLFPNIFAVRIEIWTLKLCTLTLRNLKKLILFKDVQGTTCAVKLT